jgi:N-acetylglucosaminyl-diphospho-decaprenol L-rhamnosyltransferase
MDSSRPEADQVAANSSPDLSLIIVSWNVRDLLVTCLQALLSDDVRGALNLEVIVVDNASEDGSAEAARQFEGVRVIEAGENLGYGRGNNLGFSHATGRHYLVLNPDTEAQPGSLEALLCFAESHPRAGLVSPRLLNPDGSVQEAAFKFPTPAMAALDLFDLPALIPGRFRQRLLRSQLNGRYPNEARAAEPFRIDHPLGACMLINSQAFREAGGFDPQIHMYSEEVDLALRYEAAGWECWQVPAARVVHHGGQSTGQAPDRMFLELWRSRLYVYSRHYSAPASFALRSLLGLSQAMEVVRASVALRRGKIDRAEARRRRRRAGAVLRLAIEP